MADWHDPFLGYAAAGNKDELLAKFGWTSGASAAGGYNATDGPYGEGYFSVGGWVDYWMQTPVFAARTGRTIFEGFYQLGNVAGGGSAIMYEFRNNSGADVCLTLNAKSDGALEVLDANGTIVHTTATGLLDTSWQLIGGELDIGSASGIVKIWVDEHDPNGSPLISLTGIDMRPGAVTTGCDAIRFHGGSTNRTALHSPIFVGDTGGSAPLNRYQGLRHWRGGIPAAAGASAQWTASAGAPYECVDEALTANDDGDGTYNASPGSAGYDAHAVGDFSASLHGVLVAVLVASVKQDGAGTPGACQLRIRSAGGTNSDGSTLATTTSYFRYQHAIATEPGGGLLTKTAVDGLQIGYVSAGDTSPKTRVSRVLLAVLAFPDDYTPPANHCCGGGLSSMLI